MPESPPLARPASAPRPSRHALLLTLGLSGGPVVAIGLARFAYSLLLPAMREDLHWSLTQAGGMNTANAVGYLVGALSAGLLLARVGSRWPYLLGTAVTSLAVLASATTGDFVFLLALRLVAGAAGAVTFIAGASLVAALIAGLPPGRSTALLGTYFSGGGAGILLSALIVPPVTGQAGGAGWRWGWVVLGGASILIALLVCLPATLRAPEPPVVRSRGGLGGWPVGRLAPTLLGYGLFGAGYIAYVTFIVAFLEREGLRTPTVMAFWAVLGAAAVASPFVWGPVLGRLRGGTASALVLTVTAVGAALPLLLRSAIADFASALLFGGAFLTVVTAVTNLARRSLHPGHLAPAIAVLTVCFGIGQSLGPVLAGALSDGPTGIRTGLLLSVALLVVGALATFFQRSFSSSEPASP